MDTLIARQPILDRDQEVLGYELLFRPMAGNASAPEDPLGATARVVADSMFLADLKTLTGGKPAFINMPREFIVQGHYRLLPPELAVLEIPATTQPDRELLIALDDARVRRYRISLDNVCGASTPNPLFPYADFLKVDVLVCRLNRLPAYAREFRESSHVLIAEKVETREMYARTLKLGYRGFQGYFFARPSTVACRDIPASKLTMFRILQELQKPELDLNAIEAMIEQELALSYKLLRYLRSAHLGWHGPVDSVRHALMLLGTREFRSWASVIALAGMAADQPMELVNEAVLRGRFCQLLGRQAGLTAPASELFMLGLFSVLDSVLDRPMPELLAELALNDRLRDALTGVPGELQDILGLVISYGTGDWTAMETCAARLRVDARSLPPVFLDAVAWAHTGVPPESSVRLAA